MGEGVTIVIPNHREPLVDDTVRALRREIPRDVRIHVQADPEGRGVGWALREGLAAVRTPWVIFVMADGSEAPDAIAYMIAHCTDWYDAVWGNRWISRSSVTDYPWGKRILNRLGNYLIALFTWSDYTD